MDPNDPRADWLANARDGMSRRQFLAAGAAAGATLAGFAAAATPVRATSHGLPAVPAGVPVSTEPVVNL